MEDGGQSRALEQVKLKRSFPHGSWLARALGSYPGGLVVALAFRGFYLVRFGDQPCGMNINFLLEAKALRFGYDVELRMPLVRVLLAALRNAGASAAVSLGILYLASHLLLTLGVLVLARTVLGPSPRVRASIALALALLPALATDSGYRNISCTLGAALFVALAALLVGRRAQPTRLMLGLMLAAGAASCRPESALCVGGLACALAVGGRRMGAGRIGAAVAAAGFVVGLLIVSSHSVGAGRGPSARIWGSYSFYAFYNASPYLWRLLPNLQHANATATEYLRYAETARSFGGFEENGGSIVRALLSHPGKAALWFAAKPVDLLISIVLGDSFTPLVLLPLSLSVRRACREGWRCWWAQWASLLGVFTAPLAYATFWSQGGHAPYLLFVAPLLLLAAMWGLEPWLTQAANVQLRYLTAGTVTAGALLVTLMGPPTSTSPVFAATARWLEANCRSEGCLVNVLPEVLDAQTWANLQAGAPLPAKDKRAEWYVFRHFSVSFLDRVRWDRRLAQARAHGWHGPVFYLRSNTTSLPSFSDDFHPEHLLEGEPDLVGEPVVATFRDGSDLVEVFAISPAALRGGHEDLIVEWPER